MNTFPKEEYFEKEQKKERKKKGPLFEQSYVVQ